jgi:hypothetical protein
MRERLEGIALAELDQVGARSRRGASGAVVSVVIVILCGWFAISNSSS